ncbi:nicotinate-nucleotide adenylyltransferase [Xylophilus ampelinus]|uniref:Probable nicotinate-nucleotide adenylyltransferase n=1 Tax=Xylophilus ampelinus TaxID=54067 RepID=A0A318SMC7_9BURK|nr:nicotinate-nucleotide adenylyltransferase [Xylophilus ampelinus]PYE79788.1 nicotinate-nucleotide adenylyltransferase [Xylophilus ampelinus]
MFGGAFDPPHRAHVALARAAVSQLGLDCLHVFPTGHAWHKSRILSPAQDRLAMARAAFADEPQLVVDDREMRRPGPTYTADTLNELAAEHPGAALFLVMGADQASRLGAWHAWEEIVRIAIISIAGRPSSTSASDVFHAERLPGARIRQIALPAQDISATDIRQRVAEGRRIDLLVPPVVAGYIDRHHLYRTNR